MDITIGDGSVLAENKGIGKSIVRGVSLTAHPFFLSLLRRNKHGPVCLSVDVKIAWVLRGFHGPRIVT